MGTKVFLKELEDKDTERLRLKIVVVKGKVVDMVVQYESVVDGKWTPIARYDCAHGFLHRDVMFRNGDKRKEVIAIERLEDALAYAQQDFKDHWQSYKDRYLKGEGK
jgi:hypothetical protein